MAALDLTSHSGRAYPLKHKSISLEVLGDNEANESENEETALIIPPKTRNCMKEVIARGGVTTKKGRKLRNASN